MTLFDALYAFFEEHRRCGELDGDFEGDRVVYVRGAVLVRLLAFG